MAYSWDASYRKAGRVDAEKAGAILQKLASKAHERLSTAAVIDAARPKHSPLHPGFEWDDSLAAAEHRNLQARQMIKSLRLVVEVDDQEPTRVFLNVRYEDGQAYSTVMHILDDEDLYTSVLNDAINGLESWQRRYKDIKELKNVYDAINQVL